MYHVSCMYHVSYIHDNPLHPNHLGEPDTPCTVRFFEIRISSFTVLIIPLSFVHHIPVDHHKIPHLVHHAYSLALQLDATHTH